MSKKTTKGEHQRVLLSYVYQWLSEIALEVGSSERDTPFIDEKINQLVNIINTLGENGEHISKTAFELSEGMLFEAELVMRLKPGRFNRSEDNE